MDYATHYDERGMDCQTQKTGYPGDMANDVQARPRLTPKGERTRARIIDAAARLIYERGVAGTTLDDVRAAAEVSGSQLYHYFADKEDLVQAVISRQADVIVGNQEQADLATNEGLRAWRDMVIAAARFRGAQGGGAPRGAAGVAGHGHRRGPFRRRQGRVPPRVAREPARGDRSRSPRPRRGRLRPVV